MNSSVASNSEPLSPYEQYLYAREILRSEGDAILGLSRRLDRQKFCRAVDLIFNCAGSVIVSGMGKAGLVGQKIVATLASTGTCSHFLHPGEAIHGDLGRVSANDLMLMLSFSGETEEIVRLLPSLAERKTPILAITSHAESSLGRAGAVVLDLGPLREAGSLGLAPSTSTTAMLALGDALALVTSRMRCFSADDFARFHPGGSLGRKLSNIEEIMRPLDQCRLAEQNKTVRYVFVAHSRPGRRSGAIMVTDPSGRLSGIFTDSDLARLLESNRDTAFDGPLCDVMTCRPKTVLAGSKMSAALAILAEGKISELPVVDSQNFPVGLIDITDVVGLLPREDLSAQTPELSKLPAESAKSPIDGTPPIVPFRINKPF